MRFPEKKRKIPGFFLWVTCLHCFQGLTVGDFSTPALADLDGDGDLDLASGELYGTFAFFENTGTVLAPAFVERTGTDNPLATYAVGYDSAPFTVHGIAPVSDTLTIEAGITTQFSEAFSAYVEYALATGAGFHGHNFTAGVSWSF